MNSTETLRLLGGTIERITPAEARRRAVARWGEEKVAANEADVARRFNHKRR